MTGLIFAFTFTLGSVAFSDSEPKKILKEAKREIIILLATEGTSPDELNRDILSKNPAIQLNYGPIANARYLISKRKKIGIIDNNIGLSPEEIQRQALGEPDFSLVHPDSIEARLQRYIVLTYSSSDAVEQGKLALRNNSAVDSIREDGVGKFLLTPNDTFFYDANTFQWGAFDLNLPSAWDRTTGHAYIGVPDSGLDSNNPSFQPALHPDLANFRPHFSWDLVNGDSDVFTQNFSGHGTHVTGTIAASTNNGTGVAGVCWDCSVSFAQMVPSFALIADSYNYFFDIGVQAINSSFGAPGSSSGAGQSCPSVDNEVDAVCDAILLLSARDIVVSAAAGNGFDGTTPNSSGRFDFIQFPASDPATIAVGATNITGNRAQFSDYGPELDLVAPGTDLLAAFERGATWNAAWNCGDNFGPGSVMAYPAIKGTLPPQPPGQTITFSPAYGAAISYYDDFPHEVDFGPFPTPVAEAFIFTTDKNPVIPSQPLVPLYRMSFQGSNGSNTKNLDHVYATEQSGINAYKSVGYQLDGIEGYIFDDDYAQPTGTEKLYRRYNSARDDHAIFPESKLSQMAAAGYTQLSGNSYIGYVYLNTDADNDHLIDGFERAIGTCLNDNDTDNDGIIDGDEVLGYPRTDPVSTVVSCDNPSVPEYPWQDNATGTLYTNRNWNYALGYHFTPQVNGTINQLGGYFNGTKEVIAKHWKRVSFLARQRKK